MIDQHPSPKKKQPKKNGASYPFLGFLVMQPLGSPHAPVPEMLGTNEYQVGGFNQLYLGGGFNPSEKY